jgi:hypothetical protein
VTLYCGHAIDSIAFSYTDENGNKQSAGPWGGPGGFQETVTQFPPLLFFLHSTERKFKLCTDLADLACSIRSTEESVGFV